MCFLLRSLPAALPERFCVRNEETQIRPDLPDVTNHQRKGKNPPFTGRKGLGA
jgi:hypothetical protein